MKITITSFSLSALLLVSSCTTRIVSEKKPLTEHSFSIGKTYNFIRSDGEKATFRVSSITDTEISGTDAYNRNYTILKSEIASTNKTNTLGTVGIAVGVVSLAVLLPAYIKNEPVGGR